jgi:hypothetical protein
MIGSQERRRYEVNYKLMNLDPKPKEMYDMEIFPRFLSMATKNGIYDCPVQVS